MSGDLVPQHERVVKFLAEQREYLATVKSAADALLRVINDLLDFAKIEAGKLELDHADFCLRHVLGETLRALAVRAHELRRSKRS